MSERDDERVSDAAQGEKWLHADDMVKVGRAANGQTVTHVALSPGQWQSRAATESELHLAAELAACRARRDEGNGEALQLLARVEWVINREGAGDGGDDWCPNCERLRRYGHTDDCELSTLLAGRATATTATPAGEEK